MLASDSTRNALPPHIKQSVQAIAQFHAEHHRTATRRDRAIEAITKLFGRTDFIILLTLAMAGWIIFNLLALLFGLEPPDPPPFTGLLSVVAVLALYLTFFILATEQRADNLAERREQLTLELALLAERKTSKVIELLEASRPYDNLARDPVNHAAPIDHEAADMARPVDPSTVTAALDASHAEAKRAARG
jgi:uncharacterized membrane protein